MMKKMFSVFLVLFCISAGLWATDPVVGYWKSIDDKSGEITGGWEIYEKDGLLYGKVVKIPGLPSDAKAHACDSSYKGFPIAGDVSQLLVVGNPWIYNLEKKDIGEWKGGHVIDTTNGNRYTCDITFHLANGKKYMVDTLEMRGRLGPFGKSQYWEKTTLDEIMGL